MNLLDVQSQPDTRGIGLDEVGVSDLRYPVSVFDAKNGKQDTVASVSLSVSLSPDQKGSHLSRFVEVLDAHARELTLDSIPALLRALQERLASANARLRVDFPYFIRRHAPITGTSALMDYTCGFAATIKESDISLRFTVRVPVTSVCPCSKAISDYGAHNQRGHLTIEATPAKDSNGELATIWMEDLIEVAEASASSPVYPLLKRADERHVTMAGYDHPLFVEDMVRGVAERLRDDLRIAQFCVEALNDESIHNHGAFARLSWPPSTTKETAPW